MSDSALVSACFQCVLNRSSDVVLIYMLITGDKSIDLVKVVVCFKFLLSLASLLSANYKLYSELQSRLQPARHMPSCPFVLLNVEGNHPLFTCIIMVMMIIIFYHFNLARLYSTVVYMVILIPDMKDYKS